MAGEFVAVGFPQGLGIALPAREHLQHRVAALTFAEHYTLWCATVARHRDDDRPGFRGSLALNRERQERHETHAVETAQSDFEFLVRQRLLQILHCRFHRFAGELVTSLLPKRVDIER